jgi:hypothetical protein
MNYYVSPLSLAAEMEVPRKFSTKLQLLHRIQEGLSFGDGDEYNPGSYQRYASNFTKHYKRQEYPEHDLWTAEAASQMTAAISSDQQPKEAQSEASRPVEDDRRLFIPENLEQDYWDIVENRSREVSHSVTVGRFRMLNVIYSSYFISLLSGHR